MVATPQLSVGNNGPRLTVAVHTPDTVCMNVTGGPQSITGLVLSTTVTVNTQVCVLPAASVAVIVTEVTPSGKLDPDAGTDTSTGAPLL